MSLLPPAAAPNAAGSPVIVVLSRDCQSGYVVNVQSSPGVRTYAVARGAAGHVVGLTMLLGPQDSFVIRAYSHGVLRGVLSVPPN
jgi:hypothetical protein